jgi:predicted flap endonuclease-1-like 5' DNA nuclease
MENINCLIDCFPWDIFIFALLIGLAIWALLNWLLGRRLTSHSSELQDRINFLEGELEACRKSKVSASSNVDLGTVGAAGAVAAPVAAAAFVTPAAAAAAPVASKKDDLKIVEGIGPKIEELCNNAGIYTFTELAATSAERLKGILDAAGARFQMHDPTTWPVQSALARDGKWDELKKWQDELNRGKA